MEDEFRSRSDIGITVQAYLRDSEQDLRELLDWAKERSYPLQ
jgi:RHH-type proline utilization regulon transcriptional repressor/proline dehydrogenase/delta 1-pyrroline-5-carboxylate dehydrogenase